MSATRERAESLLRFLKQRSEQLERFHSGSARLVMQQFCDFFDRDDVVGVLAQALARRAPMTAKAWYDAAQARGAPPPLPEDPTACMALRYALIKHVRMEKIDLRYFVTTHYPGSFLDEKLMHWKRLVVHPFGADCRALADLVIGGLAPGAEWVDLAATFDEVLDSDRWKALAFGPRAWSDEDDRKAEEEEKRARLRVGGRDDAPAPAAPAPAAPAPAAPAPAAPAAAAPSSAERVEAALDALLAAIESSQGERAHDLRLDVAALRLEARRPTPRPERAAARLEAIARAAPALAEACRAVREAAGLAR